MKGKEKDEQHYDDIFDDDSDNSLAKVERCKKLPYLDEEHRKKIVLKFREYVSSKIGSK